MKAVVVESFDPGGPRLGEFREPEPDPGEQVVTVRAAALSNLVKGQASGRHYSSSGNLPFVPGSDGVGVLPDGHRVFFFLPRAPWGAMAERSLAAAARTIRVPDALDDVTAAALGNPGLASWGALLGRAKIRAGETVLVNGATGAAGQQAVQAARRLGAGRVIATGRDEAALERLRGLGVDQAISLRQSAEALVAAFQPLWQTLDVVLDYLWGASASALLTAAKGRGAPEGERRVRYIQVGSISGNSLELGASSLRASGVELMGSGLGSLSAAEIVAALTAMYESAAKDPLMIATQPTPLGEVEAIWNAPESGRRVVFTI